MLEELEPAGRVRRAWRADGAAVRVETRAETFAPKNRLLASVPPFELARLDALSELVAVRPGQILDGESSLAQNAYFPEDCVIEIQAMLDGATTVGVVSVGIDGCCGLRAGWGAAATRAVVLSRGSVWRIDRARIPAALAASPALKAATQAFLDAQYHAIVQACACDRKHDVSQRIARELLLLLDRSGVSALPLTHAKLGEILGVRRSTVTVVAERLRDRGAIRYARGVLKVIDRARLEAESCSCYASIARSYASVALATPASGQTAS